MGIDIFDTTTGEYLRSLEDPVSYGRTANKREINIMIALPNGNLAVTKKGPSGVYILHANPFSLTVATQVVSQGYRCNKSFFSRLPSAICLNISRMLAHDLDEIKAISMIKFFKPQPILTIPSTIHQDISQPKYSNNKSEEFYQDIPEDTPLSLPPIELGTIEKKLSPIELNAIEKKKKEDIPLCSFCTLL
jgi:hypothetical protein